MQLNQHSPTPSPSPTPAPTPTPTPIPTPTPTPAPSNVGNYRCLTVEVATTQIDADGFVLGTVTAGAGPSWIVMAQDPAAGTKLPFGAVVNLTAEDPATAVCP